jgi:DNA modification methylase
MNQLPTHLQLDKIYQADCLEFMRGLPDKFIDLVIMDSPYNDLTMFGSSKTGKGKHLGGHGWFANDQIPEDEFNIFFLSVLQELQRILKPNKHIYIFCNHKVVDRFKPMFMRYFHYVNLLVWDKMVIGLGWCYRQQHELILLGSNGKHNKIKVQNKSNILRFKRHPNNRGKHPTQKPENIISELISNSSQEGDLVFDPFMGSGTTAVAALKLNRNFLGCELEAKYIQMANYRLGQLYPSTISNPKVQNG